jgi:hypothetical protein
MHSNIKYISVKTFQVYILGNIQLDEAVLFGSDRFESLRMLLATFKEMSFHQYCPEVYSVSKRNGKQESFLG